MGPSSVQGYGDWTTVEMHAVGMGLGAAGSLLVCEALLVSGEGDDTLVVHPPPPKFVMSKYDL